MNLEALRHQLLFAGLSEQDIDWLASKAEEVTVPVGSYLMREGESGDALYIVVEGEFEVTKRSGSQDVVLALRGAGELFGEMSLLDQAPHSASVRAVQPSHLFKVSGDVFRELLATKPQATLAILRTVTSRLRNTEAMLRQNEKMNVSWSKSPTMVRAFRRRSRSEFSNRSSRPSRRASAPGWDCTSVTTSSRSTRERSGSSPSRARRRFACRYRCG